MFLDSGPDVTAHRKTRVFLDLAGGGTPPREPAEPPLQMPRVPTCQLAARMRSGIVSVERAPSGSTRCVCCMTAIGKGSIRVWNQGKPTTSLRDRKRAHLRCSRHFALANREHDVRQLTEAVNGEDAAWAPEEQLMCVEAIAAMGSASSSSASTGPASAG